MDGPLIQTGRGDTRLVEPQLDAWDRYADALEAWSTNKMENLKPKELEEFVTDGVFNTPCSQSDAELAQERLANLYASLRDAEQRDDLPPDVAVAWDLLRAIVCINQERARARREGWK